MSPDPREPGAEKRLNPQAAFVVQFLTGTELPSGVVGGRVEHVASGRHARFESIDQLLRFFADTLPRGAEGTD